MCEFSDAVYGQGPLSEGERWVLIESVGED